MEHYRTASTPLASYLIAIDHKLIKIDYSNSKHYEFIFSNSDDIIEHATNFTIGKATVNASVYATVFRKIMRLMRNQSQWGDE